MPRKPFDLESALRTWARQLDAHSGIEPGDREELLIHLRDKYEDLVSLGQSPQEAYDNAVKSFGIGARLSTEYQQARLSKPAEFFTSLNTFGMFFLNLRSASKSIIRKKSDFLINMLGLTVAFCSAMLINQYVQFEESHDTSLPGYQRIYRVAAESYNLDDNSLRGKYAGTFYAVAPEIASDIPEVEAATRLLRISGFVRHEEDVFSEDDMYYGDGNFFKVFGLELLQGAEEDLNQLNTIFITESTATKYFGSSDPIGQNIQATIQGGAKLNLEVRGVYRDLPENSHLKINALISNRNFENFLSETNAFGTRSLHDVRWRLSGFLHYAKLVEGAHMEHIQSKLDQMLLDNRGEIDKARGVRNVLWLENISNIHLSELKVWETKEKGDPYMILFLKVILIVILALGWINYINLTIAKSMIRAKEVGIMKIVGSSKKELAMRFIMESLIINLVSIMLAVIIVITLIPEFQVLVGKKVFTTFDLTTAHWVQFTTVLIPGMLLSSIYPAFILASFAPASILKGTVKTSKSGILLRKITVVFQFMICLILMVFIYTLNSQVSFMKQHDLGFELRKDIVIERPIAMDSITNRKLVVFKNMAVQSTDVAATTISNFVPGLEIQFRTGTRLLGHANQQEDIFLNRLAADEQFIEFYDFQMIAGRGFFEGSSASSNYIILNRTATEQFGFLNPEDALGERLAFTLGDTVEIVGVVEDFAQQGLKMSYLPIGIQIESSGLGNYMSIATNASLSTIVPRLEKQFRELFPSDPFEYFVLDSAYNDQYGEEEKYSNILMIFTVIAMLISALGIVSLASFAIRLRGKEIAVRKVLGASLQELLSILSREYVLLVGIAGLISLPIGYWLMSNWLDAFAFRISLTPDLFLLPFLSVVLIVLVLVGKYVLGAAISAPVKALRDE